MANELGTRRIDLLGYIGTTFQVSEGRYEIVAKALAEVAKINSKYLDKPEIPRKVIGEMRRKQIEVMVDMDTFVPDHIYESKEFPLSLLHDLQSFFLMNANPI